MASSCSHGDEVASNLVVRMDMGSLFPNHTLVCALVKNAKLPESWKAEQSEFSLIDADLVSYQLLLGPIQTFSFIYFCLPISQAV